MRTLAIAMIVAACACRFDKLSTELACTSQADCGLGTICTDGFCVGGGPGPDECPASCASCDLAAGTCDPVMSGERIVCPTGFSCAITCNGASQCSEIECETGAICQISCDGPSACGEVECSGACQISCDGPGSCARVECRDACACDTTCSGVGSCEDVECRPSCQDASGCSSQAQGCSTC
jgi:hypothetical protein